MRASGKKKPERSDFGAKQTRERKPFNRQPKGTDSGNTRSHTSRVPKSTYGTARYADKRKSSELYDKTGDEKRSSGKSSDRKYVKSTDRQPAVFRRKTHESSSFSGKEYSTERKAKGGFSKEYKSSSSEDGREKRGYRKSSGSAQNSKEKRPFYSRDKEAGARSPFQKTTRAKPKTDNSDGQIRLNKFIANAGICSRREADDLIKAGAISVNGKIITELGFKVNRTDMINYGGQGLKLEKNVYILVNKPKDFITTVDDPHDRKTVMWLIKDACRERVYPVGRLDRNTTGLLLMTNDGELTDKLTHPSSRQKKIYHVELDKPLPREVMNQILNGVELEDGFIKADAIEYVSHQRQKNEIGIELHSGRNRIVRRIFEHFGYTVKKLDRVYFAGLTKKDLPRGKWRFLTSLEVNMLKMV